MRPPRRTSERRPQTTYDNVIKYTSLVMVAIYLGVGLYVLLSSPEQMALSQQVKMIVGGMLIVYAFIRFVRVYQRYFKKSRRDEEI